MARAGTVELLLTGDMSGLENVLSRAEQGLERTAGRLRSIGATLAFTVTAALTAAAGGALASTISFETSVAQMAKTIEASDAVVQRLADGFTDLSEQIPVARNELALIAAEAGQLGIAVENIPSFTRVVADLRVATNLGDAAGTTLARLSNIMGDVTPEFDRMGATIVDLGNHSATTEAEIAHMALRIAGAGKVIGLHHPEVLALSAALSSVGIRAEAGGTAISRVMVEIANAVASGGEKLGKFAQVAGMSASDFKQAFEQDAAGAVVTFIEGLGRLNNAGVNVFAVLEDVEFQNVRIRDALLRAAGAGDLMRRSLDLGRTAWQENTALVNEASRFYQTTGNQLVLLRNRINNVAGELGDVLVPALMKAVDASQPVIDALRVMIRMFSEMPAPVQSMVIATGALLALLGPLALGLSAVMSAIGALAGAGGLAAGATAGVSAFSLSVGTLAALLTPGGAILVGLGVLAALFMRNKLAAQEAADAIEDQVRRMNAAAADADQAGTLARLGAARKIEARLAAQLEDLEATADAERAATAVRSPTGSGSPGRTTKETRDGIAAINSELEIWRGHISGLEDQYIELAKAQKLAPGDDPDPVTPGTFDFGDDEAAERAKKLVDLHKDLATSLRAAAGMEELLGEAYDENRAKASAYRSTLQALLEEGVAPADAQIHAYAAALIEAEGAIKAADDAEKAAQEAKRERNRLESDALSIVQQAMTAAERHEQNVRRLNDALAEGLITQEQYNRAVAHLDKELAKTGGKLKNTLAEQGVYAGEALIRGLLTGANNMGDILKNAMINLAITKMMGPLKLALGIASPSKVFRGYGEAIGEGLALGIQSSANLVGRASDTLAAAVRVPNLTPAYSLGAPTPGAAAMAGAGRMELDVSKLPRPLTPFEAMRDAQWQAMIRGSMDVAKSQGYR